MKIISLAIILFLASCASTEFKEVHRKSDGTRGAYGYRIERVQDMKPFSHYAAFTGNSKTSADKAKAYTEMAALKHCREQGLFLMIDSNVRNTGQEADMRKESAYQDGDKKTKTSSYQSFMVLFGCSSKNSGTKISERARIVNAFCKAKDTNQGKYCSPNSKYRL